MNRKKPNHDSMSIKDYFSKRSRNLEINEIKKVDNISSIKEVDLIARRSADLIIKGLAA